VVSPLGDRVLDLAAVLPLLIATDLDGTLLRRDGSISARTHDVMQRVSEAGIRVVLVTGRPVRRVRDIARALGAQGTAICGNGAVLYDLATDAIVEQTNLPGDIARELITQLRGHLPEICFAVETGLSVGREPAYQRNRPPSESVVDNRLGDALELAAQGAVKLIAMHPSLPIDVFLERAREIVQDRATVTHAGSPFLEIAAAGVTKAWALAAYCERLGIAASRVIAFGDMPNDLPMLEWAGRGVAVANAHPTVLAIAHEVTEPNEEDGVAAYLERLLDGR
jgi:Cof subfamily protein (haloacid dehalogenase superfamily)